MARLRLVACVWLLASMTLVAQVAPRALVQVLGEIYKLREYTAFDWVSGALDRGTLTLRGFARSTQLKAAAEAVARGVPGVDEVVNEIELLPAHRGDDEIRIRAYAAIYGSAALERYAPGSQLSGAALRELQESGHFGLDAVDVGRGPHGIHIIVNGARVLLLGQVRAAGDRRIAEAAIRTLPGVLGVTNQLRVSERR
jgi:hypothetical protein